MYYIFTNEDYCALADSIIANLNSPNYFSGEVTICSGEEYEISLTASLIIYRRPYRPLSPDDAGGEITGLATIWYDVKVLKDGEPVEEDFDMEALKEALIG